MAYCISCRRDLPPDQGEYDYFGDFMCYECWDPDTDHDAIEGAYEQINDLILTDPDDPAVDFLKKILKAEE